MEVLSYIISVIGLVALIVSGLLTFLALGLYSAFKLVFGVPWLTWLTLDEVVEMGHSRFWCKLVLPAIYRGGNVFIGCTLHIRLPHNLPEETRTIVEVLGFRRETVQFYEFKLTSHWGSRRGKWKKSRVEILQPLPMYVRRRKRW